MQTIRCDSLRASAIALHPLAIELTIPFGSRLAARAYSLALKGFQPAFLDALPSPDRKMARRRNGALTGTPTECDSSIFIVQSISNRADSGKPMV